MELHFRNRSLTFPRRPLLMGILNLTDDSFCGDGSLDPEVSLAQARRLIEDGADILDIGAESARTNRGPITIEEEIHRFQAFLESYGPWVSSLEASPEDPAQLWPPMVSVNTWRPEVVEAVLPLGVDLLNDIGALPDPRNAKLCASHQTALLIMHSIGLPKVPHLDQHYASVMDALTQFFEEKLQLCEEAGLPREATILDPGIDFAKQRDDNLRIYQELGKLQPFDRPILLPVSRKTVIGEVLDLPDPRDRDAGTLACMASGMHEGAHIFRVHNVQAASQAVRTLWALRSKDS